MGGCGPGQAAGRAGDRQQLNWPASASVREKKESNWLPAPNGPIYLVMRLYWPKTEPPSILPPGEGSWQPPVVKMVQR